MGVLITAVHGEQEDWHVLLPSRPVPKRDGYWKDFEHKRAGDGTYEWQETRRWMLDNRLVEVELTFGPDTITVSPSDLEHTSVRQLFPQPQE